MTIAQMCIKKLLLPVVALIVGFIVPPMASADAPGRGLTANFEVDYLKFIIDHHYSALRMTELAAGTDMQRDASISQGEGTSPTSSNGVTPAKASMEEIKSMARRNNRMQREEILTAQRFLKQWYGMDHAPQLRQDSQAAIQLLEGTATGEQFDHAFLEVFSRHHFAALHPSLTCLVASDIKHDELHRYCNGIVHSQVNDIEDMRELLSKRFNIDDYQPTTKIKGQHSGGEGAPSE